MWLIAFWCKSNMGVELQKRINKNDDSRHKNKLQTKK